MAFKSPCANLHFVRTVSTSKFEGIVINNFTAEVVLSFCVVLHTPLNKKISPRTILVFLFIVCSIKLENPPFFKEEPISKIGQAIFKMENPLFFMEEPMLKTEQAIFKMESPLFFMEEPMLKTEQAIFKMGNPLFFMEESMLKTIF